MDSDSRSPFLKIPTELMLKILLQVDSLTLIKAIPFVDKDFNQLSKIPDLYERYEVDSHDTRGIKMRWILNHPLYKQHLKLLRTDSKNLLGFDINWLKSLRTIIIDCEDKESYSSPIARFIQKILSNPVKPRVDIKILGCMSECDIEPNVDYLDADIETIVIKSPGRFEHLLKLQARKHLVQVVLTLNDDINRTLVKLLERLQGGESLRGRSIGLILEDMYSCEPNRHLYVRYMDIFATRVVKLNLRVCNADTVQLLETVCRKWIALRDLFLTLEHVDHFMVYSDFERPLDSLQMKQWEGCSSLAPMSAKLVSGVKSSLCLSCWRLDGISLHRDLKTAKFRESELSSKTLFRLIHSLESVEFESCNITDNLLQYFGSAYRKEFPSRLKAVSIKAFEDYKILGILPQLRYSACLLEELYITISQPQRLNLNQILTWLIYCQHQLRVFGYNGYSPVVINKQTFELLQRFTKLEFFHVRIAKVRISRVIIKEYIRNAVMAWTRTWNPEAPDSIFSSRPADVCYEINIFY